MPLGAFFLRDFCRCSLYSENAMCGSCPLDFLSTHDANGIPLNASDTVHYHLQHILDSYNRKFLVVQVAQHFAGESTGVVQFRVKKGPNTFHRIRIDLIAEQDLFLPFFIIKYQTVHSDVLLRPRT